MMVCIFVVLGRIVNKIFSLNFLRFEVILFEMYFVGVI